VASRIKGDIVLEVPILNPALQTINLLVEYTPTSDTMVLKLHGSPWSTCASRVRLALIEKGVDAEIINVDLAKGEHLAESYLKLQPFGKVPVLQDTETGVQVFGRIPS
jgi:glutathione S-transferase